MRYKLIVYTKKGEVRDQKYFKDKQKAIDEANKYKYKTEVFDIPDVRVGYKIYRNGFHWGDIIKESESLWLVAIPGQDCDKEILNPFLKETFEDYFISGMFDVVE